MPDSAELVRTFELLNIGSGVPWTAKNPLGRAAVGGLVTDADQLTRRGNQQDGWDFFVCLNPSARECIKPSKADITHLACLGIDMDPHEGAMQSLEEPCRALDEALTDFTGTANSHAIIFSGRGIWAWQFIQPTPLTTETERQEADSLMKGFLAAFTDSYPDLAKYGRIDSTSADLSRIARCPGMVNHKTGAMASITMDYQPMARLPFEAFERLSAGHAESFGLSQPPSPISGTSIQEITPHLNVTSRQFILLGIDKSCESRHRRLWSTAKDLHERNVAPDIAEFLLWSGAERCLPNLNKEDPGCVRRILRQVWKLP